MELGPPTHARPPCRFFFLIWRRLFSPMMDGGETGQAWEEASLKRPGSCFLRDSLFFKMTASNHPGVAEDAQAVEEEILRSFALLKVTECCRSASGWGGDSTTPAPCPPGQLSWRILSFAGSLQDPPGQRESISLPLGTLVLRLG